MNSFSDILALAVREEVRDAAASVGDGCFVELATGDKLVELYGVQQRIASCARQEGVVIGFWLRERWLLSSEAD